MQGLMPCVSPLATCPPLCLIVWKIDMWLCIVLDWVRGWVARMGFLLPALSPDPPDLLVDAGVYPGLWWSAFPLRLLVLTRLIVRFLRCGLVRSGAGSG